MDTHYFAAILGVGIPELLLILVILLLLFGSKKLPELVRSLSSSVKEVRKSLETNEKATDKNTATTKPGK